MDNKAWEDLKKQIDGAKKTVVACKMAAVRKKDEFAAHEYMGQENAYDQVLHFMEIIENQKKEDYQKKLSEFICYICGHGCDPKTGYCQDIERVFTFIENLIKEAKER